MTGTRSFKPNNINSGSDCLPSDMSGDILFINDRTHLIGGLPSQMRLKTWLDELRGDPEKELSEFISRGIMYGFSIVDDTNIPSYFMSNYKSATEEMRKYFLINCFKKN